MARAAKQTERRTPAKAATKAARKATTTVSSKTVSSKTVSNNSVSSKSVSRESASAKSTATRSTARTAAKTTPRAAASKAAKRSGSRAKGGATFLRQQRELLVAERDNYLRQAEELKAEADSLALEHEPGDVQFDEEGGEGGTSNVDRELDLVLSGQARAAIAEIDRALTKLDDGTYGRCERCGTDIPQARLQALPHAALCVACKSGGLASRR